jgi:alpha-glucosidase
MAFVRQDRTFKACFPFAKNGWEIKRLADENPSSLQGMYGNLRVTPWRTVIIAKNLTALVNSDLLMNLCPAPSAGSDYSWVKPGRCLWHWWSIGGPRYEDQKAWFDAAKKLKWEYYLIDEGWNDWRAEGKDQWTLLKEVIDYGKSVGVKSLVWVNSSEMRHAPERRAYLEKVKALGAAGIKIDFIPDATS